MPTLNFKGKTFVQNHHLSVPYHQLIPDKEKSVTDKVSLHDNLIIHGDNLKALKALLPTYAGRVKCICIDPPYNTGNEGWVYNDNVNSPYMKEWIGKTVDKDDLTRHDKWLCMMIPRLKILKELLSEDGIIYIFIDDNECSNLKSILDDIFSDYHVATFIWHKKYGGGGDNKNVVTEHDYILCYSMKDPELIKVLNGVEYDYDDFSDFEIDEEGRNYSANESILMRGPNSTPDKRPNLCYPIKTPDGNKILPRDGKGTWSYELKTLNQKIRDKEIIWKKIKGKWMLYKKLFLYIEEELREKKCRSILDKRYSIGQSGEGTTILEKIFSKKRVFPNPKPNSLIKFLINLSTEANNESIVLDSFAGSGTTGHSVLELNKEDGGNRRFILIEFEDYANRITAERIRRVIKGIKKSGEENLRNGLSGKFSYFELGDAIEHESILHGKKMPSYKELARYVYYTATGEEFNDRKIKKDVNFIGSSKDYDVYMYYEPDVEKLKRMAFTLDMALSLPKSKKRRLVFAPTKYIDNESLQEFKIDFCQLPFEIYRMKK